MGIVWGCIKFVAKLNRNKKTRKQEIEIFTRIYKQDEVGGCKSTNENAHKNT
jgi:hypothetical protein